MKLAPVNKLFGVSVTDEIKNARGEVIQLEVLDDRTDGTQAFLPAEDEGYIIPLQEALMLAEALDSRLNEPVLLWGHHGSGKSVLAERICRILNRPCIRVQHSVSTEESDVVGQWVLEGDKTVFHYGPLARAMRDGLVYIGDEYDFALPNVLAVYQAVLEGAPLHIKQAPENMAIVKPHKDFRFIATGNTNGSGDETGLYQGTQIQNAANYSRFGTTIKIDYQKPENEKKIIHARVGDIPDQDSTALLEFAGKVRKAYEDKTITNTLSTRELISIAKKAIMKGRAGPAWSYGIETAFTNRMSSIDAAAIKEVQQRIFG